MLLLWCVLILNVKKVAWPCPIESSLIVSMFLSLTQCASGKHANHEGEYGLEITAVFFHLDGTEKTIRLAKNEITKIEEKLNETVKH